MTERVSSNWEVVDKQSNREHCSCGFCNVEIGDTVRYLLHSHAGTICAKCLRELKELLLHEEQTEALDKREEIEKTTTESQRISSGLEFQSGIPLYCKFCMNDSQQCEHLLLAPKNVVGICSDCVTDGIALAAIGL